MDGVDVAVTARLARPAVLGDCRALTEVILSVDSDLDHVAALIHRHQLSRTVLATLGPTDLGHRLAPRLAALPRQTQATPDQLLAAFGELARALEAVQVPVLLIKGAYLAERLYGGIERRSQHDVDVLVRIRDFRRARGVARGLGYSRRARDEHSISLRRGPVEVDLHHSLRASPAYRIDAGALWDNTRSVDIRGVGARCPSDDDALALLLTGFIEDVGLGMAKVRSLCDIWLLARALDPSTDWDSWLDLRFRERTAGLAMNGLVMAMQVLDVASDLPRLSSCLERRGDTTCIRDTGHALGLLAAERDSPGNLAWFGEIYPGSLTRLRAHRLRAGLPGTLRYLRPHRWSYHRALRRARTHERD